MENHSKWNVTKMFCYSKQNVTKNRIDLKLDFRSPLCAYLDETKAYTRNFRDKMSKADMQKTLENWGRALELVEKGVPVDAAGKRLAEEPKSKSNV